jgi:outer membrane protein assembly factor BamB
MGTIAHRQRVLPGGGIGIAGVLACGGMLAFGVLATAGPAHARDWPSFRGAAASGVDPDGRPPVEWDVAKGTNVAWTTPIPGFGHSSPVVSGDKVFLTTAVALEAPAASSGTSTEPGSASTEAAGAASAGTSGAPTARYAWRLYCLERGSGRILWERTAHEGVPRVKHHAKASHASATVATDGRHVVAMMGSEGLYAYDTNGQELWRKDLGRLDVGYVDDPTDEWGPASSPVIHDGLVIVQNDRHKDSYLAAFEVATGREKWRSGRDEMPAWSTPLVHTARGGTIVTSSPRFIRGHDPSTGSERWRIPDGTQVKVPTPIAFEDLAIVTGGYPTGGRPILAVRADSGQVAWRLERGSPYTPTPLVYQGVLYVCVDNGVIAAYDARSGRRHYQERIARGAGGFSASPVAAAGGVYLPSEDGVVYVVRAGTRFEVLARNDMKEMMLATPAISGELLLVRTRTRLVALRQAPKSASARRRRPRRRPPAGRAPQRAWRRRGRCAARAPCVRV